MQTSKLHFIGVAGIGMRGLARLCLKKGWQVTGSDDAASQKVLGPLIEMGLQNLPENHALDEMNPDWVIYSSAIAPTHPQRSWADAQGKLLHRSQLLASFFNQADHRVAVTGSHGKTTVSSWASHVLHLKHAASYCVGGIIQSLGLSADLASNHEWVIEADESDASLKNYEPSCVVITNINNDHLNTWETVDALEKFMLAYAKAARSPIICQDDPRMARWPICALRYGFDPASDLRLVDFHTSEEGLEAHLIYRGDDLGLFKSRLIGRHNAQNMAAVVAVCLSLGMSVSDIKPVIASFKGAGRRLEALGELAGVQFYDDYAVHPTEIETSIGALKNLLKAQEKLRVIFQPHRSSRLKDLMVSIAQSLKGADELWICPLYLAGEPEIEGINSQALTKLIQEFYPDKPLRLFDSLEKVQEALREETDSSAKPRICATMGAGSVTNMARQWLASPRG
jgi:UDP-N-acetylmuramate--alanine ligase